MSDKVKAAVLGSFIGDALSMGVHWVYEPAKIEEKYGRVEEYVKPELAQYHVHKEPGEFTHYGDQTYELLVSVSTQNEFDLQNFVTRWGAMFNKKYKGYVDKATRQTIDNLYEISCAKPGDPCESKSSDLGGASRIAPLLIVYHNQLAKLEEAAKTQTSITHNHPQVVEAAGFFAEVTFRVLQGATPSDAIHRSTNQARYPHITALIKTAVDNQNGPTIETIQKHGSSCDVRGALPSTIHLILAHEDDFREALIQNVMAGGDSAARNLLVGMVLGAYHGLGAIPEKWIDGLKQREEILGFINQTLKIPLL